MKYILLMSLFLFAFFSKAQTTTCTGATTITPNGACLTGTISDAAATAPLPSCGPTAQEGWYQFTIGSTLSVTITAQGTRNLAIQLISGTCGGTLTQLVCQNAVGASGTVFSTETISSYVLAAGTYYIKLVNVGGSSSMSIQNFCVTTAAPPTNPCTSITNIAACGSAVTANLTSGAGAGWSPGSCGFTTPGSEVIFSFTATTSGTHNINISSFTGPSFVDFFFVNSTSGCSSGAGWTCIDDMIGTGLTAGFTLTAGQTYYILLDAEVAGTYSINFSINCPTPGSDPCTSITNIAACGTSVTANLSGTGAGWSPGACLWSTPGDEAIFSFTATTTGTHTITVSSFSGFDFVDFMYVNATSGCSSTAPWTCIDDMISTGNTAGFSMTAGQTYYILLDPEWADVYSLTFNINCPGTAVTAGDCSAAVNVCTNLSFAVDPNGFGSINELCTYCTSNPGTNVASANSGCLLSGELNSTWMVINVASSGTLEFSFGADGGTGCYDWAMWSYNASTCSNIFSNTQSPVRCNWNFPCEAFTGMATPLPAGGEVGNFEPELSVTTGQQFIICFSNFSSLYTTVPLQFFGTASISCTPLPIELASFTGAKKDNRVELKWTSASELNAKHYDVTHSVDGTNFYSIGKIDAVGSVNNTDYVFDHLQPSLGANYYKLIAVDNDGSFDESAVVVVDFSRDGLTIGELQPNPVNALSYLEIISETETAVHLSLIDVSGRLIQKKEYAINKGLNKLKINYEPMPKGVYHVMVNTDNGLQFSKKMLVH